MCMKLEHVCIFTTSPLWCFLEEWKQCVEYNDKSHSNTMRFKTGPNWIVDVSNRQTEPLSTMWTTLHRILMMWVISQRFAIFTDHEYCSLSWIRTVIRVLSGVYWKSSCFKRIFRDFSWLKQFGGRIWQCKKCHEWKIIGNLSHYHSSLVKFLLFFLCNVGFSSKTLNQKTIICERKRKSWQSICALYTIHNTNLRVNAIDTWKELVQF